MGLLDFISPIYSLSQIIQLCSMEVPKPTCPDGVFFFPYNFIYLWQCWVFIAVWGFSLVAESGGCSLAAV